MKLFKMMGGTISLESESGVGSSFTIRIPQQEKPAS
jgi:signal transduction histidine kinase